MQRKYLLWIDEGNKHADTRNDQKDHKLTIAQFCTFYGWPNKGKVLSSYPQRSAHCFEIMVLCAPLSTKACF